MEGPGLTQEKKYFVSIVAIIESCYWCFVVANTVVDRDSFMAEELLRFLWKLNNSWGLDGKPRSGRLNRPKDFRSSKGELEREGSVCLCGLLKILSLWMEEGDFVVLFLF